jgi:hypothetical protein
MRDSSASLNHEKPLAKEWRQQTEHQSAIAGTRFIPYASETEDLDINIISL